MLNPTHSLRCTYDPPPLKLRPYGGIAMCVLLYLLSLRCCIFINSSLVRTMSSVRLTIGQSPQCWLKAVAAPRPYSTIYWTVKHALPVQDLKPVYHRPSWLLLHSPEQLYTASRSDDLLQSSISISAVADTSFISWLSICTVHLGNFGA